MQQLINVFEGIGSTLQLLVRTLSFSSTLWRQKQRFIERFIEALRALEGAYSLVSLTNKKLIGARDPLGIRPLVLGELDGCPILASETCALDIIGADFVRDIEPGEMVIITGNGVESLHPFPPKQRRAMLDEHDEILKAILGGHAARAEQLMNEHMAHYVEGIAARYPEALGDPIRWQ